MDGNNRNNSDLTLFYSSSFIVKTRLLFVGCANSFKYKSTCSLVKQVHSSGTATKTGLNSMPNKSFRINFD